MVVFIDMLKGPNLKRDLGVASVAKRYHNKNKHGGNFGINIIPKLPYTMGSPAFELSGEYNMSGEVYDLTFGYIYQGHGVTVIRRDNYRDVMYPELMATLRNVMARLLQEGR